MDDLSVSLPGCRNEGLNNHEKEEHDEGAHQVGVEHFISHLGELDRPKEIKKQYDLIWGINLFPRIDHMKDPLTFSSM